MRKVLALSVAIVFTLGLASAALAQSTQTTPGSSSSQPAPSGTAPTPAPTTDSSKPSTDPSKSATDPTKSSTDPSKTGAAGKTGQDKAMGHDKARTAAGSMRGQHRMMGEVTKVDAAKGAVTLKTDEGELDLHFPPSALQGIKEGDKVEVQLAIRPAAGGAASKDMGKTGAAPKAGKSTSSTDPAKPKTTP